MNKKFLTLMNFLLALLIVSVYSLKFLEDSYVIKIDNSNNVSKNDKNNDVISQPDTSSELDHKLSPVNIRTNQKLDYSLMKHNLNVEIMHAWIDSLNTVDSDIFKLNIYDVDYDNQIELFIEKTGIIKNGKQVKPYVTVYIEMYGQENLRNLYNSYKRIYGKNLK